MGVRVHKSADARCPSARLLSWPTNSSPCTGKPISCGCARRPGSATRSTGSAATTSTQLSSPIDMCIVSILMSRQRRPNSRRAREIVHARPTSCASVLLRSRLPRRSLLRMSPCRPKSLGFRTPTCCASAAASAHAGLLGDPAGDDIPDAVGLVAGARAGVERRRRHDPALKLMADRLAEAGYLLSDVATDLAAYADDIEADPIGSASAQNGSRCWRAWFASTRQLRMPASTQCDSAWASRRRRCDWPSSTMTTAGSPNSRSSRGPLRESMVALAGDLTAARTRAAEHFRRR